MYTRVQNLINDSSTGTLAIIKETLNLKVKEVIQRGYWRFAIRDTSITTTASTTDYYLPNDIDKIIDIRQTSTPLQLRRVWIGDFDRLLPNPTATGKPRYYCELLDDRVLAQPSTAAKLIISSDSNQDISGGSGATAVSIYGVVSSVDRKEVVSLSATNVLSSVNSYSKLYSVTSDSGAAGTLRFTQALTGTVLLQIYANETQRSYKTIKIHPIPDATYTLYIRYQALPIDMVSDSDSCLIPDRYEDVVVSYAVRDMLLKQGDSTALQAQTAFAEAGIQRMLKEQDLMWDYVPTVRMQDSSAPYIDSTNPFSYY